MNGLSAVFPGLTIPPSPPSFPPWSPSTTLVPMRRGPFFDVLLKSSIYRYMDYRTCVALHPLASPYIFCWYWTIVLEWSPIDIVPVWCMGCRNGIDFILRLSMSHVPIWCVVCRYHIDLIFRVSVSYRLDFSFIDIVWIWSWFVGIVSILVVVIIDMVSIWCFAYRYRFDATGKLSISYVYIGLDSRSIHITNNSLITCSFPFAPLSLARCVDASSSILLFVFVFVASGPPA